MGERPLCEWNAADRLQAHLGGDAPLPQVGHERDQTAKLEIAAEDGPNSIRFNFIDGDLAILGVIKSAKRDCAIAASTLGKLLIRENIPDWRRCLQGRNLLSPDQMRPCGTNVHAG